MSLALVALLSASLLAPVALATHLVTAPAPTPSEPRTSDPTECLSSPAQAPPGGRQCDPWVDAWGDDMFGPLNMQDNPILFGGVPLMSLSSDSLQFGDTKVCLEASACTLSVIQVEKSATIGGDITLGASSVNGAGAGVEAVTDTTMFFGGSLLHYLLYDAVNRRFDLSDPLAANAILLAGRTLESPGPGRLTLDGTHQVCFLGENCLVSVSAGAGLAGGSITTSGAISVAESGIVSGMLADATILAQDIATGAVTTRILADGTILAEDVATGAITTVGVLDRTLLEADLATGAVTTRVLADGTILAEDLATGAVTTIGVLDGTLLEPDFSTGAVTTRILADGTILAEDLSTGAVTTLAVLDGTLLDEDFATGSVSTRILADGTILAEDLATGAVTTLGVLDGTLLNEDIADATITGAKVAPSTILGSHLLDGTVDNPDFAEASVTGNKVSGSTLTGFHLVDGSVDTGDIANGAVTSLLLLDGTILPADFAEGAVQSVAILDGTILEADVANGAITGFKVAADTLTGGHVVDASIVNADLADATLEGGKVALSTLTGGHLVDGTVSGADVGAETLTGGNIADASIGTADVLDGSLVNADLADATLTGLKISAGTLALSHLGFDPATQLELDAYAASLSSPGILNDVGNPVDWTKLKGVPSGFADGVDADTLYGAGAGLALDGTTFLIATGGVLSSMIADGTITAADMADGAVTSAVILDGTIGAADLGVGSVGSDALLDGSIGAADVAAGAITSDALLDGTIGALDLGAGAVTTLAILDNDVLSEDIADGTLSLADLAFDAATQAELDAYSALLADPAGAVNTLGNPVSWTKLTGVPSGFADGVDDDTLYGAGAGISLDGTSFYIADGALLSSMIFDGTVAAVDLASGAVTSLQILDSTVGNADLGADAVTGGNVLDGSLALADLATDVASQAELDSFVAAVGTVGIINDPSSLLEWTQLRGVPSGLADGVDADTLYGAGSGLALDGTTFSIASGGVDGGKLAADAVTGGAVLDGSLSLADLDTDVSTQAEADAFAATLASQDGAVNTLGNPVSWTKLVAVPAGFADGVDDNTLYGAGDGLTLTGTTFLIGTGAVLSSMIADGTVGAVDLATGAVGSLQVADGAILLEDLGFDPATQAEQDAFAAHLADGTGVLNSLSNPLDWSQLKGVPAGFADGVDTDTTYGAGGGLELSGTTFLIASNSVIGSMIADGTIEGVDLGTGSVGSLQIANGAILPEDLGFDPATQAELDAFQSGLGSLGTINTATNPVEWTKLKGVPSGFADGTDADSLASAACPLGAILESTGGGWTCGVDDNTVYTGVFGIYVDPFTFEIGIIPDSVTGAMIQDGTIGPQDIGDGAIRGGPGGHIADGSITREDLAGGILRTDALLANAETAEGLPQVLSGFARVVADVTLDIPGSTPHKVLLTGQMVLENVAPVRGRVTYWLEPFSGTAPSELKMTVDADDTTGPGQAVAPVSMMITVPPGLRDFRLVAVEEDGALVVTAATLNAVDLGTA